MCCLFDIHRNLTHISGGGGTCLFHHTDSWILFVKPKNNLFKWMIRKYLFVKTSAIIEVGIINNLIQVTWCQLYI